MKGRLLQENFNKFGHIKLKFLEQKKCYKYVKRQVNIIRHLKPIVDKRTVNQIDKQLPRIKEINNLIKNIQRMYVINS